MTNKEQVKLILDAVQSMHANPYMKSVEALKVEFPADDYWRGYNEAIDDALAILKGEK